MIKQKVAELKERNSPSALKMAFFDSILMVPDCWDKLVGKENVYLTTAYLAAIENAMSEQISFKYILFFKADTCVVVAAFQLIELTAENLDLTDDDKKRKVALGKVMDQEKVNCLINGTLFSSGELGFYYKDIDKKTAYKAFVNGINRLCDLERSRSKIQIKVIKEFYPESIAASNELIAFNYRGFKMEPNMILTIKEEWNTLEDYLSNMTSKYRNKAKNALKRSSSLVAKNLTEIEIENNLDRLDALFKAVHSKAKYKLGTLDVSSFVDLKKNLGNLFDVRGYFDGDNLVGFGSMIWNNNNLDSNYVGLDYELNRTHSIYQRILIDLVQLSIERKCGLLRFGRTASEIKSNFGAVSVDMQCYVRTANSFSNKLIKPIIKRIDAPEVVVRNPFKD